MIGEIRAKSNRAKKGGLTGETMTRGLKSLNQERIDGDRHVVYGWWSWIHGGVGSLTLCLFRYTCVCLSVSAADNKLPSPSAFRWKISSLSPFIFPAPGKSLQRTQPKGDLFPSFGLNCWLEIFPRRGREAGTAANQWMSWFRLASSLARLVRDQFSSTRSLTYFIVVLEF